MNITKKLVTVGAVWKIVGVLLCAGVLLGCGSKDKILVSESSEAGEAPGTPAAVLASLYQPILEPFVATYTYTRSGENPDTGVEETYAAIKSTVTQDADLDVQVLETGRWTHNTPDYLLVSDELYVRVRELDEYGNDLEGVDAGQWVPYYEWVAVNLDATESLVLGKEEFASHVDPERPYLVRSPVALVQGEQFLPVPASCVDFRERRPARRVIRLDERRWKVTCATGLGVLDEFITEYDTDGRLVRFYSTPESCICYDLAIVYGPNEDVREPDTTWWQANQPLVSKRLAELAARLYGD
jgi:hypothetical protein